MLELGIAALVGLGWIGLSYAVEEFFPIGDIRWLIFAAICFISAAILLHWRGSRLSREVTLPEVGRPIPPGWTSEQLMELERDRAKRRADMIDALLTWGLVTFPIWFVALLLLFGD